MTLRPREPQPDRSPAPPECHARVSRGRSSCPPRASGTHQAFGEDLVARVLQPPVAREQRECARGAAGRAKPRPMKFWDSSAIIPLLVREASSADALGWLKKDPDMLVWWGTAVECTSAIARRERDGSLDPASSRAAFERLGTLSRTWQEVSPVEAVRKLALRLIRVHELRAADSMHLAAALVASESDPSSLTFVCLDRRLDHAARLEGLECMAA